MRLQIVAKHKVKGPIRTTCMVIGMHRNPGTHALCMSPIRKGQNPRLMAGRLKHLFLLQLRFIPATAQRRNELHAGGEPIA